MYVSQLPCPRDEINVTKSTKSKALLYETSDLIGAWKCNFLPFEKS